MLDFDFKENAPAVLMALASLILAATFLLPIGGERRRFQTRYQGFSGFAGTFTVHHDSAPVTAASVLAEAPHQPVATVESPEPKQSAKRAKRRTVTAAEALKSASSHRWPHLVSAQEPSPIAAVAEKSSVAVSSGTAVEKSTATPLAPPPPEKISAETADSVAEAYESDPAKYLLERNTAQGDVSLSFCGLSRQKSRYILKVAILNKSAEDFFVKGFGVREGTSVLVAKSFFRLFVEPGRSREGFVVFDVPHAGADVHVALKEDREKGRVLELTVPYPF